MKVAISKKEQYIGLNNPNYTEMYFPNTGMNTFRGLDNGQPVQLTDQTGKTVTLHGPNDTTTMKGNVMEHKLKYGGSIDLSAIIEDFPNGKSGIKINPKNKGKFNATKKRTGKTTEELTHSKNPLTRKRAIFAQNASHWNHGDNGLELQPIEGQFPADFQGMGYNVPTHIDPNYGQERVGRGDFTPRQPLNISPIGTAATALSLADHFMPYPQYEPINRIPKEYTSHPNGTGSQALYQQGGTMSDTDLFNNYYNQFKSQHLEDPTRLANIMVLSHKYNVPPSQIFTKTTHPYNGSQAKYQDYQIFDGGKEVAQLRDVIAGNYAGSDNYVPSNDIHATPIDSKKVSSSVAAAFDDGGGIKAQSGKKVKSKPKPTYDFTGLKEKPTKLDSAAYRAGFEAGLNAPKSQFYPTQRKKMGLDQVSDDKYGIILRNAWNDAVSQSLYPKGAIHASGGGLSRDSDYGSEKHPYPGVSSSDFAGPHRSYPIPSISDARDALRLAHLHHNQSVINNVYEKYPSLRKGENGMEMSGLQDLTPSQISMLQSQGYNIEYL